MKKILIISLATGSGHVRAASAMKNSIATELTNMEVLSIDLSDFLPTTLNTTLTKSYDLLARELPTLWGFVYKKTNNETASKFMDKITHLTSRINSAKIIKFIDKLSPDYILCTHFIPARILSEYRKNETISWKLGLIMTDYDEHSLLTINSLDQYFVATDKMRWKLSKKNIDPKKIYTTGIPISPDFYTENTKTLNNTINNILVLAGGQGLGHPEDFIEEICSANLTKNIIAVAGNNTNLKKKLSKIKCPNLTVHGWVDNIPTLLHDADIVISKPGGLTVSECIAMHLPIIMIDPIPGQEERNVEYVLEQGYGVLAVTTDDILYHLTRSQLDIAWRYRGEDKKNTPATTQIIRAIQTKLTTT